MARASLPRKCKAGPSSSPSSGHRAANKGKRLATKKTKQAVRNPKPGIHTARGSRSSVRDRTATTPSPVPPVPAVPDVAREEAPDTVSSEAPWVMRRPAGTAVVHYGANGAGYELLYEWELLSGCIGYLIRHLLPEKMSWDTLDVETREKMLSWAPNAKYALESAWLSRSLWEGWVWRLLVARVFDNHDGELWEGYGLLKAKFLEMTRRPPHRLVEKPVPYRFLQIMTCRDWTEEAAREIKKDHREWRALTGELFHLANGYEFRFEAGYVSGLLQQELGRFFLPQDPQKHGPRGLAHHLDEFDTRVLLVDRWFHVSPQIFDMSFTHPETGQAHGFLYEPTTKDDMTDKGCVMHAHSVQSVNREYYVGYPVDYVVRPYLHGEGLDLPGRYYKVFETRAMEVVMNEAHLIAEDEDEDEDEDENKVEDGAVQVSDPAEGM